MEPIIECSGITKTFRTDPLVRPLDGLDLAVYAGSLVAVTGVSGKGKSTLLNIMGGLLRPDAGKILFKGLDLASASSSELDQVHRRGMGFIFQSPHLFQALTARENLEFACMVSGTDAKAVDRELSLFGLEDRADHLPSELSVGQRRRLVIARALIGGHDVLLADEPTNDLDDSWSNFVFERLVSFARSGERAVVLVTHDEAYARRADALYVLEDGRAVGKAGCAHE